MPTREQVFDIIETERRYQDLLWGPTQERGDHTVTEFLVYVEDYVSEAKHIMSRHASPGADEEALHILRKVAALCVACMEQNGAIPRDINDIKTAENRHNYLEQGK